MHQLHHRGQMPPPPRDADGAGRDRADPRRADAGRSGAGRKHFGVSGELRLGTRLLLGGIAGFVGTMAMTSAMRRLHQRLPEEESYPLTPREIIDATAEKAEVPLGSEAAKDV